MTGGMGYIGSHTTVELQAVGYEVIIVDNLSNSNREVLNGIKAISGVEPTFYQVDCNDQAAMREIYDRHRPDGVIHFAASKAVGESVEKPLLYYRNNILSLIVQLELMKEFGTKGIVFSSSCTVYGQPKELPVTEEAPILPATSPYGNSKQINEEIIRDTIHSGVDFRAILLRYFNPIGAHPSAEIGELPLGVPQNLIPYLTQTAAGIRKELTVFGDDYNTPDGSCIRDYIHVVDLAIGHLKALNRHENDAGLHIYNLGTGTGYSVLDMVKAFEQANNIKIPYRLVARRPGDIATCYSDPSLAAKELNWTAERGLEQMMKDTWNWQKNNPKGYRD